MTSRLWKFLTTDIKDLVSTKSLDGTANTVKAIFELSAALKPDSGKPQVETLAPLVSQLDSLLDVLNSPLGEVVEKGLPFVAIATGLLRLYLEKSRTPPSIEQCIALGCQAAYLESLKELLGRDLALQNRLNQSASESVAKALKQLAELEVTADLARRAVTQFPQTDLAKAFGKVLSVRLEEAGLAKEEIFWWVERVAWNTPQYMMLVWAQSEDAVRHLGQATFSDWRTEQLFHNGITDYQKTVIEPGPKEKVFGETDLTFKELYVPLNLRRLDSKGKPQLSQNAVLGIRDWIQAYLQDESTKNQILFLQGEAGRGKSVFCRMFADWVRIELFPAYIPVLVRLRDLRHFETSLAETLSQDAFINKFINWDVNWLKKDDVRFLFLLDGFDELFLTNSSQGEGGLKDFLDQVGRFQKNCHHRFLITGRPLAFQGMDRLISQTESLLRARIEPMSDTLRKQWFHKWGARFGLDESQKFEQFLDICPEDVNDGLAREPLLLYLLGMMHRDPDSNLNEQKFKATGETQAKVSIYDEAVRWVIEKQRQNQNFRLLKLEPLDLREALNEAALCVIQSGNEIAKLTFLEERLSKDNANPVYEVLRKAREKTDDISEKKQLNNILTSFYIKPASDDQEGAVEFVHKSFGEFLFAERLANALEDWSRKGNSRRRGWEVPDDNMHREIYDLFGYGSLSVEIVGYLMVLLQRAGKLHVDQWVAIFERLNDFYLRWWEGEFIDAIQNPEINLPRGKMIALRTQISGRDVSLGLRQVDAFTGLNVLILLFQLHRYAQSQEKLKELIFFYPCGQAHSGDFDPGRLAQLMGYSECLFRSAFNSIVGNFLDGTDLSGIDLSSSFIGGSLSNSNLQNSNFEFSVLNGSLSNADAGNAVFRFATFNGSVESSSFEGAQLDFATINGSAERACFDGANLNFSRINGSAEGASFVAAKIDNAAFNGSLNNADFRRAILSDSNLLGDLHNVNFDNAFVVNVKVPQTPFNKLKEIE